MKKQLAHKFLFEIGQEVTSLSGLKLKIHLREERLLGLEKTGHGIWRNMYQLKYLNTKTGNWHLIGAWQRENQITK